MRFLRSTARLVVVPLALSVSLLKQACISKRSVLRISAGWKVSLEDVETLCRRDVGAFLWKKTKKKCIYSFVHHTLNMRMGVNYNLSIHSNPLSPSAYSVALIKLLTTKFLILYTLLQNSRQMAWDRLYLLCWLCGCSADKTINSL